MRHALGRILWIVPSLALVSLLAFVILVGASAGATGFGGDVRTERRLRELPLFLNPSPADVRSLAHDAAARIARGDPDAAAAATTLVRLGGAALPHLLPTLEALPPAGRARVALALMPIAHRMDIPSAEEVHGSDAAILFWQRFWEDRGLDFRPAVVRRAVRRAAQEASATRREEIRELDTFALAELVDALGSVSAREDVERVARVTALLEPLASACAAVPSDATVAAARAAAARCQRWWSASGTDYVELDGPSRMAAMIGETRYGKWLSDAAWFGLGSNADGNQVLAELLRRGRWTGLLLLAGVLGGLGAGALLGSLSAARGPGPGDFAVTALAVLTAATPGAVLAVWLLTPAGPALRGLAAAAAMVLPGMALLSRHQRVLARRALREEPTRTLIAFGAGPLRLARVHLRQSSTAAAALLGSDLPVLLTAAFVVERAAGIEGLGPATAAAVAHRDLAWLMAVALVTSGLVALAQIVSDELLGALDPRLRAALSPRQEGFE